jgi:hypothetical protein
MKLTESTVLTTIAVIASVAVIFAFIGIATPKWLNSGRGLWNCNRVCSSSAAALAIIGLLLLITSIIFMIILIIHLLPRKFRSLPLGLLILATLFLMATTTSYLRQLNYIAYSYELMVTAHAFAFLASVLLAFWFGTTLYGSPVTGTTRPVIPSSTIAMSTSRVL